MRFPEWEERCMVNCLFSVLWLIDVPPSHFNTLCFSVPSHLLSLKRKSESLSWSPIKDLHCYIFHFNYRIQSRLWLILLFIRQLWGKKKKKKRRRRRRKKKKTQLIKYTDSWTYNYFDKTKGTVACMCLYRLYDKQCINYSFRKWLRCQIFVKRKDVFIPNWKYEATRSFVKGREQKAIIISPDS